MTKFCTSCGNQLNDSDLFCSNCGNRIAGIIQEQQSEIISVQKKKEFVANYFMHDADRIALQTLKTLPGFSQVIKGFMKIWSEKQYRIQNMSTNLRISEKQLPKYHEMLCEICNKLGIEVPELYLQMNGSPNAYTAGDTKPFIVITSGLLETLPEDLIPTVLAHECGHIVCHHCLYNTIGALLLEEIGALLNMGIAWPLIYPIRSAFFNWMRCSELSADRVAALCDGTPDKVVEMCMYFSGFNKNLGSNLNTEEFMNQAKDYQKMVQDSSWNKLLEHYVLIGMDHPLNAVRAMECFNWGKTERFDKIVNFINNYNDNRNKNISEYLQEIPMPESAKHYIGRNVSEVQATIQALGFSNVIIAKCYQKKKQVKNRQVLSISINGKEDFNMCEWFPVDSQIVIEYYVCDA